MVWLISIALIIIGVYIILKKSKNKSKEYYAAFGVNENMNLHMESNIDSEELYMYATVAFIIKVAWIFSGSNTFVADQVYRRLYYMDKGTIHMVSLSEIPVNQKFKISLFQGSSFTTDLPLIGDLYIMEGVFCFLSYVYNIIAPKNQEILLLILNELTPHTENINSGIRGLLNLNRTMNEIAINIFNKYK